ncbi:MAG: hypothetical protein ACI379_12940 [Nocardioides sp.]|uniref:hypothetical protein n=1 Tax=Nocardioides sp. TaxID=35761 RepID=UPI003EFCDBA1
MSASAERTPKRATPTATVQVSGTVKVVAGEEEHDDQIYLETDAGQFLRLESGFEAQSLSRFTGTVAIVDATSAELASDRTAISRAAESGEEVRVLDGTVTPYTAAAKTGTHRTYVAMATNLGRLSAPNDALLKRMGQAQKYWVRESRGRIKTWATPGRIKKFRTTTTTVARACGLGSSDFMEFTQEAGRKAFPGVDFSGRKPNHLVVVVPGSCTHTGVVGRAQIGVSLKSGGPAIISSDEYYAGATKFTTAHELGHTFGMHHANTPGYSYGDAYEVMGSAPGDTPMLGAAYRAQQGIFAKGEVTDVNARSTSVTLNKISSLKGRRVARFVNPDNGAQCFVEYRDGGGRDAKAIYTQNTYAPAGYGGFLYRTGVTVTCEDLSQPGKQLQRAGGGVYGLRAGNEWSNGSGTYKVRVSALGTTATVVTTSTPGAALSAGSVSVTPAPALEGSQILVSGFGATITGARTQWLVDGKVISTSVGGYWYAPLAAAGKSVKARVTVYASGRSPRTATSAAVRVPLARMFYAGSQSRVVVTGKARVGKKLGVRSLVWIGADYRRPPGLKLRHQWLRNGRAIRGATGRTYRLTRADKGKRISVVERASAPKFVKGYRSISAAKRAR